MQILLLRKKNSEKNVFFFFLTKNSPYLLNDPCIFKKIKQTKTSKIWH